MVKKENEIVFQKHASLANTSNELALPTYIRGTQEEDITYSEIKTTDSSSPKTVPHCGPATTQAEDVTYSEIRTTDSSSPQRASHCEPAEKSGPNSHPYRLTAVCLGLLCALLLTAIIALCVHNVSRSDRCCSTMERDLEELRANYSIGWEQFNTECYYFSTKWKNWQDSRSDCLKQGAELVIIESEKEQDFIYSHTKDHYYWIGLSDSETEGTWLWVDRTPLQKG
ncbi:CD209 antigen-like protein E [Megalops cyprinoides]|uniref:CD209 antigen-like protein E n=1 Tax=Megalops cyprinoides TaxID=118141 RepID=UPI0018654598|nr:CD209 antigen-like protein E [Megalops cyprinoides]